MNIGIMGSGAVGSFFGSFLTEAGHEVKYIARGNHLAEMNKNGLVIMRGDEKVTIHRTFTDNIEALDDSELILFCVKSGDTKETAERLKKVIPESAYVMTLQNGVSNEEELVKVLGEERVLSAAAYVQASVESPGMIKQSGRYKLVIGALGEKGKEAAKTFSTLLNEAQIPADCSRQIMLRKWKKYLFSLLFNPLSAATDRSIGQILEDPHLKEVAWMIGLETIQVARLCGYPLTEEDIHIAFQNAEFAKEHTTSMLQDIRKGKVTEADELIGYVLKKAHEHKSPMNTLKTVYLLLKSIENTL
ncbi:ketopantoate reductase family protein [Sporosarcina sp. JAI121]|uniref:ketopantoate reductase family protein n=1 Tax=Sporosarcina sp. JAI121 TaxID=2723064 RepID=UPI0015C844C5|nr:2-dehydropantoate 2-reductase [Sporosarcina sp. JAI121]NYF23744.1 2-dehydropantoate 2-reductase [Sporosarcina sp. JAI121]